MLSFLFKTIPKGDLQPRDLRWCVNVCVCAYLCGTYLLKEEGNVE